MTAAAKSSRSVVVRDELETASLHLGGTPIPLADYRTTGIRALVIGPSGTGKTSAGLLIAEQLSQQGWISVLVDAEGEIESLYGAAESSPDTLRRTLKRRDKPMVVVSAVDATEFIPYGKAILEIADELRKPIFVMVDEGQLFSASKRRKNEIGEANDLIVDMVQRGRKRRLDFLATAHRFSASLHRSIFTNANMKLIGRQEDPTAWSALAPQFRDSKLGFHDLAALAPGEFFVFTRQGVERTAMPMAAALARVAPKATIARPLLPSTFAQWDCAMQSIPDDRLQALDSEIIALLSTVAGLSRSQLIAGMEALDDERATRA